MKSVFLVTTLLFTSTVMAEDLAKRDSLFDLGVSTGWNGPAGGAGVTAEFRVIEDLGAGLALGTGLWGVRVSPQASYYPFGVEPGLYVAGGMSLNLGGESKSQNVVLVERDVVPTLNAFVGWRVKRFDFGYLNLSAGYSLALTQDNYRGKSGALGSSVSSLYESSQPGGVLLGVSSGFTI